MKKQVETSTIVLAGAGWQSINKQHQLKFQRNYVACHEPSEHQFVTDQVLVNFPHYRRGIVQTAIDEVCQQMPTPRASQQFFDLLQQQLETRTNAGTRQQAGRSGYHQPVKS